MVHGKILHAEKHKGVWLRGRAHPSHGWGHKFKSCNAHQKLTGRRLIAFDLFRLSLWRHQIWAHGHFAADLLLQFGRSGRTSYAEWPLRARKLGLSGHFATQVLEKRPFCMRSQQGQAEERCAGRDVVRDQGTERGTQGCPCRLRREPPEVRLSSRKQSLYFHEQSLCSRTQNMGHQSDG